MMRLLFLLIIVSFLTACQQDYNRINQPYNLLPATTATVFKINELNDFINSTENHAIISAIYNKELKTTKTMLKNINTTRPVYVAFLDKNNNDYLILTENDSTLFLIDSIPNHISETIKGTDINKTQIDSSITYHKIFGNVFTASNNLDFIKNLSVENKNTNLIKLIETVNQKSIASVIFTADSPNYSKLLFLNADDDRNPTNQVVLDLKHTDQSLKYNGIITLNDSIQFKIDCFKNTIPQKINTTAIAPYNTQSLLSITYQDFSSFNKNRIQLIKKETDSTQTFLNYTHEITLVDDTIILYTLDTNLILESIEAKTFAETFRGVDIYNFDTPDFFESRLEPFMTFSNAHFFAAYEEFIIFSDSIEVLKSSLTSALNNNTLVNTEAFKNISKNLSTQSSLFIYKNSEGLSKIFNEELKGYNANAVQYIYEDGYAHVNGVVQKFKKRVASNNVTEAFSKTIKEDIIYAPQTVKNHVTNTHDIVVQDVNNVMYLISSSGNILWTKQLQGKILGKIEQIDMFKNGRLQLAFNTSNRLYVLDRNGKDAPAFPLKFKDEITQPLSVFDYDKRRNYRLLVTQGKILLMYDQRGKTISGFRYSNNGSNINSQPKHFRIGNKDYIAFTAGESLKILDRQGNVRVDVKDKIRFSNNEVFLYQNMFTTTNTLGQLVQVNTKGNLSTKNLNLPENHSLETTSKTLVSMTENKLNIKSRTIDLDYGDYTAPRIFYLNDKIYITTTDLQAKKVYLFDSQAKPLANFPVYGTSAADLQKLDDNSGLELITQGDNRTIVVYKLY